MKVYRKGQALYFEHKFEPAKDFINARFVITTYPSIFYMQNFGLELVRSSTIDTYEMWKVRCGRWNLAGEELWEGIRGCWLLYLDALSKYSNRNVEIIYNTRVKVPFCDSFSSIDFRWSQRNKQDKLYDEAVMNVIVNLAKSLEKL